MKLRLRRTLVQQEVNSKGKTKSSNLTISLPLLTFYFLLAAFYLLNKEQKVPVSDTTKAE